MLCNCYNFQTISCIIFFWLVWNHGTKDCSKHKHKQYHRKRNRKKKHD